MAGERAGAIVIDPRTASAANAVRLVAPVAILGSGVVAFALARSTLLTDVGLWDTAEYQAVPPLLGTLHPTGFPAYALLGWLASAVLAPLGSPAFRMDLLSAILLGVAVAGTTWLSLALTGRLSLAVIAGLGLAVTPIAWRIGTRADAHVLQLAILPYLLLALVAWEGRRRSAILRETLALGGALDMPEARPSREASRPVVETADPVADRLLLLVSALVGLAAANHRLIALFLPGIAAFVLVVEPGILRRPRFVAACLGLALLVASLLYLELPLRAGPFRAPMVYDHPESLLGFLYVVLGAQFGGTLASLSDPLHELASLAALAADQLGILAAAVPAAVVVVCARRPRYALLTVPAAVLICLFAAGYEDADIGRYYLGPALLAWTWLAVAAGWLVEVLVAGRRRGMKVDRGTRHGRRAGEAPSAIAGSTREDGRPRLLVATALVATALSLAVLPAVPDRWSRALADSRAASGRSWLEAALAALPRGALVASWWSYSTPLWYAQRIEGRREDVEVVDDRTMLDEGLGDVFAVIDSNLGRRPVYAIRVDDQEIARMTRRYDLARVALPDGPPLVQVLRIRDPAA